MSVSFVVTLYLNTPPCFVCMDYKWAPMKACAQNTYPLYEYVNVFLSGCILVVNARYLWRNSANNPAVCCDWKIDFFFDVVAFVKLPDQKFMRCCINMTLWGRDFSHTRPVRPRGHRTCYTVGTGSFPGVERPRRGVDHPPQSSAKVNERVELYFCSFSSGPLWPVLGWTLNMISSIRRGKFQSKTQL